MLYTPPGCVLYLDLRKPIGDKLLDYSGHGNHGTIYGAKLNMELPCRGLEFDGEDDYVVIPYTDVLEPDYITVEILLYVRVWRDGDWDDYFGSYNQVWLGRLGEPPYGVGWRVYIVGVGWKELDTDIKLDVGWHHLVGTYDGRYSKL